MARIKDVYDRDGDEAKLFVLLKAFGIKDNSDNPQVGEGSTKKEDEQFDIDYHYTPCFFAGQRVEDKLTFEQICQIARLCDCEKPAVKVDPVEEEAKGDTKTTEAIVGVLVGLIGALLVAGILLFFFKKAQVCCWRKDSNKKVMPEKAADKKKKPSKISEADAPPTHQDGDATLPMPQARLPHHVLPREVQHQQQNQQHQQQHQQHYNPANYVTYQQHLLMQQSAQMAHQASQFPPIQQLPFAQQSMEAQEWGHQQQLAQINYEPVMMMAPQGFAPIPASDRSHSEN